MPNGSASNVVGGAVSKVDIGRVPSESLDVVVRHLIAQHLGVDASRVTSNAAFRDDLGADSLDAFDLLLAFEDTFSIEIPDKDADLMRCVSDAVAYIDAHLPAGHSGVASG